MRKKIIVTAFLIFLMILVPGVFGKSFIGDIEATQEYLITKYYSFQEVNEDGILQYFTPQYNYLKSIELFVVNLSPDMEGDLELSLSDTEGNVIYHEIYDIVSITPGEFRNYEIFKKVIPGEQYILHLSYNGEEEKPQIMVSERRKNLLETEEMYVGEELSDFNMAITYHYSMRTWFGAGY